MSLQKQKKKLVKTGMCFTLSGFLRLVYTHKYKYVGDNVDVNDI